MKILIPIVNQAVVHYDFKMITKNESFHNIIDFDWF